jgi:phosphatidylglycerol:prolipoprotein diacylglycerol transferase
MTFYMDFPSWISPEIIPGLPFRWYGLMYVLAFAVAYALIRKQARNGEIELDRDQTLDLVLFCIIGLVVGARLFSVLVYDGTWYYWLHPWKIFWPFENGRFVGLPGMSYHGGLVGAVVGAWVFKRRYHMEFLHLADTVAYAVPLGYTFGRLGNFLNGELFGRVSSRSWAMVFPYAPSFSTNYKWVRDMATSLSIPFVPGGWVNLPRHPSQLYEALFEGIVLFLFLWFVIRPKRSRKPHGFGFAWYLVGYGAIRFGIEYFRSPDANIGYVLALGKEHDNIALFQSFFNFSMGQLFCLAMIVAGLAFLVVSGRAKRKST